MDEAGQPPVRELRNAACLQLCSKNASGAGLWLQAKHASSQACSTPWLLGPLPVRMCKPYLRAHALAAVDEVLNGRVGQHGMQHRARQLGGAERRRPCSEQLLRLAHKLTQLRGTSQVAANRGLLRSGQMNLTLVFSMAGSK